MKRLLPFWLMLSLLTAAAPALAENRLAVLDEVARAGANLQPGLERFQATVQTDRIAGTIGAMTAAMPPDVPRPEIPVVSKYWRRGASRSLIVAAGAQASPFIQQMVERISAGLAIEPETLLLPPDRGAERRRLGELATIRTTETTLADNVLQRLELTFAVPTDVGEAFYGSGLRLPRQEITRLQFDIDVTTRALRELVVQTAGGELLTAEFRYQTVPGGFVPERIRVTSPDGKVDDLLEISFTEIGGFILPVRILRVLNHPGLQDRLDVTFSDYRINPAFPAEIESQFAPRAAVPEKAP